MATVHSSSGRALPGAQIAAAIARFRSAPPLPRESRKTEANSPQKFWWEEKSSEAPVASRHAMEQVGTEADLPAWLNTPLPAAVTISGNPAEPFGTPFRPNVGSSNSSVDTIAPPPPNYPHAANLTEPSPAAGALDSSSKSAARRRYAASLAMIFWHLNERST